MSLGVHVELVRDLALLALLATAVYTDMRSRKIPNALTLGGAALGLGLGAAFGAFDNQFVNGLLFAVAGWLLGVALLLIPYAAGGMGAGDVKLLAAFGALQGPHFVIAAALGAAVAGGVIGLAMLLARRRLVVAVVQVVTGRMPTLDTPGAVTFPYAVALAAGGLLALAVG